MQQSDNIDDLLVDWEEIRRISLPTATDLADITSYLAHKNMVDILAQAVRNSRLENNKKDEEFYGQSFIDSYNTFNKDFVYRALKK